MTSEEERLEEFNAKDLGDLNLYEGLYCVKCDALLGYSDHEAFDLTCLCEKCIDELEKENQEHEN